jgi:hypothetical protein
LKIQPAAGHERAKATSGNLAQVAFGCALRPRRLGSVEADEPHVRPAPVNADRVAVENMDPTGCDWFSHSGAIGARQHDRGEAEGEDSGAHAWASRGSMEGGKVCSALHTFVSTITVGT